MTVEALGAIPQSLIDESTRVETTATEPQEFAPEEQAPSSGAQRNDAVAILNSFITEGLDPDTAKIIKSKL